MKKGVNKNSGGSDDDLLPEYAFDYSKARPNRFADRIKPDTRAVVLDPDESVNAVLRALIATMPAGSS